MLELHRVLKKLAAVRPVFHSEADFQHALAWEIREFYPQSKIRLETKVYGANTKVYLDIMVQYEGRKYAIELKYKTRTLECVVDGEEFALNNHGAQDVGRYDVLKDLQRLEQMIAAGVADEGVLIFLTNDASYYTDPGEEKQTADRDFRLHEGRKVQGLLSWGEQTGQGTMKGREEPISLQGQYEMRWASYSQVGDISRGVFRYLMLPVQGVQQESSETQSFTSVVDVTQRIEEDVIIMSTAPGSDGAVTWFDLFSKRGEIPLSQIDLRDKLATHLRHIGYTVLVNRELGKDKIDIWAEKGSEIIAIEVRYKTAFLQTIHQGKHIHLKNHGAQDVSRYDFLKDVEKLERVVSQKDGVKGFALLITNDHLYWQHPKKENSVDADFHIHEKNVLTGHRMWKEYASKGTISGREEPIYFNGSYEMKWRPYLSIGSKKNEQFQALLVEVNHG
jgi:hypothetical protein